LPVENIELVSRFGADADGIQLDRLGGLGWQSRKAKLKDRIRDMAAELIKIAAERELKKGPIAEAPHGIYDEFCARFPFQETEDQEKAIADVMEDLSRGRPMDRLICGDVGFGKTEVALRAAFVMAMTGRQVAVVVPTTLLARQHFKTFSERFRGLPVRVAQLSRLVTPKDAAQIKTDLAEGRVEIVVGTHALLAKSIAFKDLGLLIVDEEQHFGVAHPAHAAIGDDRREGSVDHRDTAHRPFGRSNLRISLRSCGRARGVAARALSWRPKLFCLPAH
jgi:transcription-repair coupling factor (superfamily II helicase)